MIWATFEYDRNAPSTKGNPQDPAAQCLNPASITDETIQDDGKGYILYASGTHATNANAKPLGSTIKDAAAQLFEPKASIVRVFPSGCAPARDKDQAIAGIDPAIGELNRSAKEQMTDDRLKNYSLIGAVWLDEPRNPKDNRGFKEGRSFEDVELGGQNRLSNASMESFTQLTSPNCLSCHNTTGKGALDSKRLNMSHIFRRFSIPMK